MSATAPFPDAPATEPNVPVRSAQVLIDVIVTLLAPMFLTVVGGDLNQARMTAAETIEAYRVETLADLIIAAKIVAFGLAALGSLSLSMDDNLPAAMILRLRANAAACDRAEHRNHGLLKQNHTDQTVAPDPSPASPPDPEPELDEAALLAAVAETQQRVADHLDRLSTQANTIPSAPYENQHHENQHYEDQRYQATWAATAADIAAETAADLPSLSPKQRRDAKIWIKALNAAAADFLADNIPPRPEPGDLSWMTTANGP